MMLVAEVNDMSAETFVAAFGDIAEHSPWVAAEAAGRRPFVSREAMIEAFTSEIMAAGKDAQLALIRAHPDLATRAKLTDDSSREQKGAGLDTLTAEEFQIFTALNNAYKSRFGFPFIFAVKGATKRQILASFEKRVSKDKDEEFRMALSQICRIFRFRIEDRVSA
jgi:2-oxo-4-hydroxy-4-carboxy-5-ureidoimidazoline decarboxylase